MEKEMEKEKNIAGIVYLKAITVKQEIVPPLLFQISDLNLVPPFSKKFFK